MKQFLNNRSRRWGHDGWALRVIGSIRPLDWTTCTTREEARELKKERFAGDDLFSKVELVKVRIRVEVVGQ